MSLNYDIFHHRSCPYRMIDENDNPNNNWRNFCWNGINDIQICKQTTTLKGSYEPAHYFYCDRYQKIKKEKKSKNDIRRKSMYKKFKYVYVGILCFVLVIVFAGVIGFIDLGFQKFFNPKRANIEREVYENTKSYVYGTIQDIGKYYDEYLRSDEKGKIVISNIVKMRFSNFDAEKIEVLPLKKWFIEIRGF